MKSLILVSVFTALTTALPTPELDRRAPPNVPSTSTANSLLAGLTVAAQGPQTGYSRDLFPHWITQSGTCNTRETVLKRDGTGVVTDSACASTSGSWFSPYDGATWSAASDVDIDHMVPLSNAWKVKRYIGVLLQLFHLTRRQSGAAAWTTARRQAFANDLTNPQLLAVTDNVNQEKGDKGPEDWKPPLSKLTLRKCIRVVTNVGLASYYCTYAKMWIKVKSVYSLTITSAEKSALTSMMGTC
jgi:hypothetical protein